MQRWLDSFIILSSSASLDQKDSGNFTSHLCHPIPIDETRDSDLVPEGLHLTIKKCTLQVPFEIQTWPHG